MTAVEVSLGWVLLDKGRKISRTSPSLSFLGAARLSREIDHRATTLCSRYFFSRKGGECNLDTRWIVLQANRSSRYRETTRKDGTQTVRTVYEVDFYIAYRLGVHSTSRTGCTESEQEEPAGANKSGEINKTFPEGGFLFILATSFHPRTNFSRSSCSLRGKYLARVFLLRRMQILANRKSWREREFLRISVKESNSSKDIYWVGN